MHVMLFIVCPYAIIDKTDHIYCFHAVKCYLLHISDMMTKSDGAHSTILLIFRSPSHSILLFNWNVHCIWTHIVNIQLHTLCVRRNRSKENKTTTRNTYLRIYILIDNLSHLFTLLLPLKASVNKWFDLILTFKVPRLNIVRQFQMVFN